MQKGLCFGIPPRREFSLFFGGGGHNSLRSWPFFFSFPVKTRTPPPTVNRISSRAVCSRIEGITSPLAPSAPTRVRCGNTMLSIRWIIDVFINFTLYERLLRLHVRMVIIFIALYFHGCVPAICCFVFFWGLAKNQRRDMRYIAQLTRMYVASYKEVHWRADFSSFSAYPLIREMFSNSTPLLSILGQTNQILNSFVSLQCS